MNVYKVVQDGRELGQFPTFMDADLFVRPLAWEQRNDPLRTPFEFISIHDGKVLAQVLINPL